MGQSEVMVPLILTEGSKLKELMLTEKVTSGTLPVATTERVVGELSESFQPEVTHAISYSYLIGQSKLLN